MPASKGTRASRLTWLTALIPVLLPFLVYSAFLSGDALLYTYDHAQLQYPRFRILCDTLQSEGGLPTWQTALYAGSPFHANPETPTLYPPVLALAWFLPAIRVMNLTILLHTALGAVGMYLLVLRLWRRITADAAGPGRGGEAGALIAALIFGFNFFTRLEHFNLPTYGAAHALIPWIVLVADHVLHGRAPRRAAGGLALLVGAQVLTGGLYVYAYTALALVLWFLFDGLLGGRESCRRALGWGLAAGVVGALLVAAKLVPYASWVETTNRAGSLPLQIARGVTMGGHESFEWSEVAANVGQFFAAGLPFLLVLLALPLLRHRVVRVTLGIAMLGALISLGGVTHGLLYEWAPPFDRIRNALRAWTLANAFFPILAGLGLNHLLSVLGRARPLPEPLIGIVLGAALLPVLLDSERHTEIFTHPPSFDEVLTRYDNWPVIAQDVDDSWRVASLDVRSQASRNEQFISVALGLEIVGGQLGRNWSPAMVRHAYSNEHGNLSPRVREGRLGILSVRLATEGGASNVRSAAWKPELRDAYSSSSADLMLATLRDARPLALLPDSMAAVFGDQQRAVLQALRASPGFSLDRHSVLSIDAGEVLGELELFDIDEVIVVDGGEVTSEDVDRWLPLLAERGVQVTRVSLPLDQDAQLLLARVAERMAARNPLSGSARFTPVTPQEATLSREPDGEAHWVTLSQHWMLDGPWSAWTTNRDGSRRKLPLRSADGVAVAFHLREGDTSVAARRESRDTGRGLLSEPHREIFPAGIDGQRIVTLTQARPRALLPGSMAAVVGDEDNRVLYTLIDLPEFPTARHSVISIGPGQELDEQEWLDIHELILVQDGDVTPEAVDRWLPSLVARGVAVTRVSRPLDPRSFLALERVARRMAERDAFAGSARFTRVASDEVAVSREVDDEARWVTLSETWMLYGGWNAWATSRDGSRRELTLHSADGVVVAFHLRAGEASVVARYEPGDVRLGLAIGSLGLLAALALLAPWRSRPKPTREDTA